MANKKEIEPTYSIISFKEANLPKTYVNFVISKWMKSFRYGNDYIKLTDSDSYYAAYKRYIESILDSPLTTVRLAVLTDEPDVAMGFSVATERVLHYVYVGLDYRGQGIGKRLVPIQVEKFTHLTRKGIQIWLVKAPKAKFDPFA